MTLLSLPPATDESPLSGVRAMWQIGQSPGWSCTTCGCMPQCQSCFAAVDDVVAFLLVNLSQPSNTVAAVAATITANAGPQYPDLVRTMGHAPWRQSSPVFA